METVSDPIRVAPLPPPLFGLRLCLLLLAQVVPRLLQFTPRTCLRFLWYICIWSPYADMPIDHLQEALSLLQDPILRDTTLSWQEFCSWYNIFHPPFDLLADSSSSDQHLPMLDFLSFSTADVIWDGTVGLRWRQT